MNRFEWLIKLMLRCAEIRTPEDYLEEAKNHPDWPEDPEKFCGEEWKGWDIMLVRRAIRDFPPFNRLICLVRNKNIKNREDYWKECMRILSWPINPQKAYPDEWPGWEEFFNITEKIRMPDSEDCGLLTFVSRNESIS
ncbi:MAG TPA: hypothetical protein PLW78_12130 [bacterium]|nr:hypothetical protein [bacterium]